jgi:hypothetical protein
MSSHTVQFSILSEIVDAAFSRDDLCIDADFFFEPFGAHCPTTWGDADYTLVKKSAVLDTIEEILHDDSNADLLTVAGLKESIEDVRQRIFSGPEYVDLEG